MLKRLWIGLLIVNVSVFCAATLVRAQEDAVEEADVEVWEFTFGNVIRIGKDQITILEYNFEQEKEMEGVYEISEATEFINIDGLSGLAAGDEVEIEFKVIDGKMVIMSMAKDDGESLEEFPEDMQLEDLMEESEERING